MYRVTAHKISSTHEWFSTIWLFWLFYVYFFFCYFFNWNDLQLHSKCIIFDVVFSSFPQCSFTFLLSIFFAMILMYNVQFIIFKLNVEHEQKKRYLRELEGQFVKQNKEKLYCYPKSWIFIAVSKVYMTFWDNKYKLSYLLQKEKIFHLKQR